MLSKFNQRKRMNSVIVIPSPADGHCFFHSVLMATSTEYKTEMLGGVRTSKLNIVKQFKNDLANLLEKPIKDNLTWYNYLSRGNLQELSKTMPELTIEALQSKLRSNEFVGQEFIELVSDVLNRDIYIIDGNFNRIYNVGDKELLYHNRPSIVLFYKNEHYSTVGRQNPTGEIQTIFSPSDAMIQTFKEQL